MLYLDDTERTPYDQASIDYLVEKYKVSPLVANLCYSSTRKLMIRSGFSLVQTGGHCTAWQYSLDNGKYILITDDTGIAEAYMLGECALICKYSADSTAFTCESHKLYDIMEAWNLTVNMP